MSDANPLFVMRRREGKLIGPSWGPLDPDGEAQEFLADLRSVYPEAELCTEGAVLRMRRRKYSPDMAQEGGDGDE